MVKAESLHPIATASFTATSYMLTYGSGLGTRWNVFPSAVSWNQGNSETGPLGSGTAEINAAFTIWNAGGTNYVLASANANPNGFLDATDGTNNIVFEKNLTSAGMQPFSCSSGGALGIAGMTHASFGAGTHVFHGETFATTLEADVSMNQGLGACTPSQFLAGAVQERDRPRGRPHARLPPLRSEPQPHRLMLGRSDARLHRLRDHESHPRRRVSTASFRPGTTPR